MALREVAFEEETGSGLFPLVGLAKQFVSSDYTGREFDYFPM
jgi:hypothetical protein